MVKLADVLTEYHASDLRGMAEYIKLQTKQPIRKAALVRELTETIKANAGDAAYINALQSAERAALAQLLAWNRPVPRGELELHLAIIGVVDTSMRLVRTDLPSAEKVILLLERKGLIADRTPLPPNIRRKLGQCSTIELTSDVRRRLKKQNLPVFTARKRTIDQIAEPSHIIAGDTSNYLRRLFLVWSDVRRSPAKRLKAGSMGKRDLKRIANQMGLNTDEDLQRIVWLDAMLRAMHLLNIDDTQITAVDTKAAMHFWTQSTLRKMPDLIKAYVNHEYDLPLLVDNIRMYSYYEIELRPSSEIRKDVLKILEQLAGGKWLPYHVLSKFALPADHGALTLEEATYRSLSYRATYSTNQRQSRLSQLLQVLDETAFLLILYELAELGIVELGYDEQPKPGQPPIAIQLSAWMQAHYQKLPPPEKQQQGQIIIQPDFQVLCMGPVPLGELATVENCALREKLDESVISYRITKESVYTALQRGENATDIITGLEDISGQPVPQNIQRTLREWEGQHHRIVLHKSITILQVDNSDLLNTLREDAIAGPLITSIDEHTAWVQNQHLTKLEDRLMTLQHLASFSEDEQSDMNNSLLWDDGHLRTRHPLPSLFVTATLRRFAENSDHGIVWDINQASVKKAANQGMDATDVLNQLQMMTGSPVPEAWVKRIKGWMGYFGVAQSAPVRLLRLKQREKLSELRQADARFAQWLQPLPGAENVAVVENRNWEDTCALLDEWGILVDNKHWW